ncbi:hypothetical protein GCM10009768_11090 [Leucobacter iarius]|uniref:Uncharacterized protein n=1 Tax=Leucobacter iarius TaxID=333963 RepID=A0ABP4XKX5_9MICO
MGGSERHFAPFSIGRSAVRAGPGVHYEDSGPALLSPLQRPTARCLEARRGAAFVEEQALSCGFPENTRSVSKRFLGQNERVRCPPHTGSSAAGGTAVADIVRRT